MKAAPLLWWLYVSLLGDEAQMVRTDTPWTTAAECRAEGARWIAQADDWARRSSVALQAACMCVER